MKHKKQLFDIVSDICKLNNDVWGNKKGSYDAKKEAALQIEEALEGFSFCESLYHELEPTTEISTNPVRDLARAIVSKVQAYLEPSGDPEQIEDVDAFDKHLDGIYIHIGSLHKLGLSSEQIVDGLQVVHNANLQKTGTKDSEGKVCKPDNFVPPEEQLQLILDKRVMS